MRHHNDKFVAAIASQDINGTQSVQEQLGQVAQRLIAVLVPILVIQGLEVVDVHDRQ